MKMTMPTVEADARALRPVATWVRMPDGRGRRPLTMIWTVPNPMPAQADSVARRAV